MLYNGNGMSRLTYGWRLLFLSIMSLSRPWASSRHPSCSGRPSLIMTLEGLRTLQNIEEILKANGIEGDPAKAIAKAVGENYKTVAEVEQKAKKLAETQAALETANKALDEAKKAAESADVMLALESCDYRVLRVLCQALEAAGESDMPRVIIRHRESHGETEKLRRFLLGNQKYIQSRLMHYIKRNIEQFY